MLHLYSVPFNFSPFSLLLLLHLPQPLSFTSLTSHACETSSPKSSTLPSLHLPVSEVSCFPTSWVPAGKSLWAQKWQCFCSTFSNAATQQPPGNTRGAWGEGWMDNPTSNRRERRNVACAKKFQEAFPVWGSTSSQSDTGGFSRPNNKPQEEFNHQGFL